MRINSLGLKAFFIKKEGEINHIHGEAGLDADEPESMEFSLVKERVMVIRQIGRKSFTRLNPNCNCFYFPVRKCIFVLSPLCGGEHISESVFALPAPKSGKFSS